MLAGYLKIITQYNKTILLDLYIFKMIFGICYRVIDLLRNINYYCLRCAFSSRPDKPKRRCSSCNTSSGTKPWSASKTMQ